MTDDDLRRLVTVAHDRTEHLGSDVSAVLLYEEAARAAERLPEPLGSAIAGVLAIAAVERRSSGLRGCLGESRTMLSLALAVLDCEASDV